jgi:Tol biopolymer transport system component/DNA-binding winged helix-turn-helix (wHTH) protein
MNGSQPQTGPIVRFGVFELDLRTGELRKSGLRVALQDQPLRVLTMLLERRGDLVTREEFRQRLWPADTFVDFEQGLNAAVKRLRAVLADSADAPHFIETLPRRGYRWTYGAEPAVPVPGADRPVVETPPRPPDRSLPRRWLALGAATLALGGVAFARRMVSSRAAVPASSFRATLLTKLSGAELAPALSPDGRSVAFCAQTETAPGLYVKDIGSGGQVRVADGPAGLFSPTWSPDGREIAFLRHPKGSDRRDEIVVVPAVGGSERRLGTTMSTNHGLDWSPDGRLLAFVDKVEAKAPDAIHLLTIETGERRRLTTPVGTASAGTGDYEPTFSPDGQDVAFIRRTGAGPTTTDLYVHAIDSSDSRPVTSGYGVRDVAWAPDGRSLVFVGGRPQQGALWIVDVAGGQARRLYDDGNVGTISVARTSRTLSIEQRVVDVDVWRVGGPASVRPGPPPQALFRSPHMDVHPAYSPDGRQIAFASTRKGGLGVRICAENGGECVDFNSEYSLSRPQWSPDGKSIAANGWQGDQPLDIFLLEIEGRFVRRMTTDNAVDTMPSWSRDGRWLYFASDRSGMFEIWKMPSAGGGARQLTRQGALRAIETEDGSWIYFTNGRGLWRMPAEGGQGTVVLDEQIDHGKWTLWRDRIVYLEEPAAGLHHVVMFDPTTRRSTRLASLEAPSGSGLAVSPDGAWILYAQTDRVTSDILVLDGPP